MAAQGAEAIVTVLASIETLQQYLDSREVQDEALTVYAHKLSKAEAKIDWSMAALQIDRNIRAFNPWPVAFIQLDTEHNLRVWNSTLSHLNAEQAQVGEIIAIDQHGVHVACANHTVITLTALQWPGGKALNAVQILQTQNSV